MSTPKLVLIDGHALAYRVFFGLPMASFTTKAGEPTNATFGFVRTLLDLLLSETAPDYLAVSFDTGATFRDEIFSDYKGTRAKMADELALQIERIRQVIQALNVPLLELEGFEADDVLGTVARQANEQGVAVHIITGDRDLLQLVNEQTIVELPPGQYEKSPTFYDVAAVVARFGVRPNQFVDYKALVGDTSDNIPGVKGIGEKTAAKLLQDFATLDNVYANLGQVAKAVRAKLESGRDDAYLSYQLARIVTDAPITLDLTGCITTQFDPQRALPLFQELEFRSQTQRLNQFMKKRQATAPAGTNDEPTATQTIIVQTVSQLQAMLKELAQAEQIAFDLETTGLDKMSAEIVAICLCGRPPISYYIPVGHLDSPEQVASGQMSLLFAGPARLSEGQLPLETVLAAIRPVLTNPAIPKVAHNAKYDYTIFDRAGLRVSPITFDTMIAEWLCDPASKFLGLKDLARHRLNVEMTNIESLIGSGKNQQTFATVPIERAAPYGADDANQTWQLVSPLRQEITAKDLQRLLELEMPLIEVLSAMEQAGIGVDVSVFGEMSQMLDKRLLILEGEIHRVAGRPFNINSTQQLSDVLFQELHLPHRGLRKTKSGYFSTAADVLDGLLDVDETGIVRQIVEYRELGKLKSTYTDALPQMVNPLTGRIHTVFNQTGSVTGRIASNSPNLQNIPIRTEIGQQIRRGFVARPGHRFVAADYSQVELRVLAHISQDGALLEAFHQDQDIHRATAATVYNVPMESVTFQQRRFAKAVNFGLIYGMGAYRLARDSELTLAEANHFIETYFARFPGIRDYLERTKEQAKKQGYVQTLFGRRRYFPIFGAEATLSHQIAAQAEREAVNHPIQGTAADIIKVAMIRLHRLLPAGGFQTQMLLQVHDELIFEAPEEEVAQVQPLIAETMSGAFQLAVPLKVEVSSGRTWLELKS